MNKGRNEVSEALILILQISITMLVPILLCTLAGVWLGRQLGVNWIAIPGFVVGAIAGFQNVYRLVKKFLK